MDSTGMCSFEFYTVWCFHNHILQVAFHVIPAYFYLLQRMHVCTGKTLFPLVLKFWGPDPQDPFPWIGPCLLLNVHIRKDFTRNVEIEHWTNDVNHRIRYHFHGRRGGCKQCFFFMNSSKTIPHFLRHTTLLFLRILESVNLLCVWKNSFSLITILYQFYL